MRIQYEDIKLGSKLLEVIEQANRIIAEYERQGFSMTLRQIYYQFVSRDLLPENSLRQYKRLGDILNKGRLAGLVSWTSMEDRLRNVQTDPSWDDPVDYFGTVPGWYHEDLWANQPRRVIVAVEKDALVGVIERVCIENDVPFLACRGYMSQSEQWRLGRRFMRNIRVDRQAPLLLHLGDHDPSGVDMTRDNTDRLRMFAEQPIEGRRLALNLNQIDQYAPPPNPVKLTDSRAGGYGDMMEGAGYDPDTCWELDALEPSVIVDLIQDTIDDVRDSSLWDQAKAEQEANRERIDRFLGGYERFLEEDDPDAE